MLDTDWTFACPDWEDRLRAGEPPIAELPLDEARADQAVAIFDALCLPDVPGQPLMRDAGGDWFRAIVRAAFGSLDRETGERRVAEIFALVPKKNSKTTNSAALGIVAMLLNERPNAEMLIVAPTHDISDLCFTQAKGMIEGDPEGYLHRRFLVQDHLKTITDNDRQSAGFKSKLRIKTFDMRVMTGTKPALVILDELHIMSAMSGAGRVLGQIRGGMLANPESLLVIITTQSDEPPAGVFRAELSYARGVRDGAITEGVRLLPVLYEFPEAMQRDESRPWEDPRNWPMVLPNLGRSITIDRLRRDYTVAIEKGAEEVRRWASQHLNVEMGMALHSDRWAGADYWEGAAEPEMTLEGILGLSDVCTVGIDGGGLDDLLGLAVIGRDRETRRWRLWTRAWAQPEVRKRRKEIADRLDDFARAGDLVWCASPVQDLEEVSAIVADIAARGLLPAEAGVGLDPFGVTALVDALTEQGVAGAVCVSVSQGSRLSPAIWGLERKLKDGTFRHCGQDLMAWCVSNAKAEQRGNAITITKETAGKSKIDPLVAAFNAAMLMSRNPASAGSSPWNDESYRYVA